VVNLGLNAALHIWFARHVEQAPGEGAGGQQTLFLQVNSQFKKNIYIRVYSL
jgi:hypothetical protein